ncbi:DUF1778 domain-containing protein [Aerococcus sp. NPDC058936]|uniref:plasmid mobilization protein n=1 Tax=Aerococcus sp. NPDC058936 TaxID=3346674 RepID=UPI0036725C1F
MAQINIRVTDEQKELITSKAKDSNKSITQYLIDKALDDDTSNVNNADSNRIIEILNNQLAVKDEQIKSKDNQLLNLQQMLYVKENRMLEYEQEKDDKQHKSWWKFWATDKD